MSLGPHVEYQLNDFPTQTVSTFLIIFRVAQGKGWSSEKLKAAMTTTIGSARTPIRIRAVTSTMRDGIHGPPVANDSTKMFNTGSEEFDTEVHRKEGFGPSAV